MKIMPNRRQGDPRANTDVASGNTGATAQEPLTLDEVQSHLERLRGASTVAAKLFTLLGEQITAVASAVPVQKGRKTVDELKGQARAHRDGLATAFDPLRDQIERLKNNFWQRNGDAIKATAKEYIQRKVKERVTVEVEKAIERYRDYIENNKNRELKAVLDVSHARAQNSLLRSAHLNEQVTWIGEPEGPTVSFEDLVFANESGLPLLANSLDLSPGRDESQVAVLNTILRHLGIRYRAIPSRTSVLLMPTMSNLG